MNKNRKNARTIPEQKSPGHAWSCPAEESDDLIDECMCLLETLVDRISASLANAPDGRLKINHVRGHIEYLHIINGTSHHIPVTEMELIRRLAQKSYDIKAMKMLKNKLNAAQKIHNLIKKHFPLRKDTVRFKAFELPYPYLDLDDIFYAMSSERQELVIPVVPTTAQYVEEWLNTPYEKKKFRDDDMSAYFTLLHQRVRSKSEVLIANSLIYADIPFKYECPLRLGNRTLYPDFTILDIRTRIEYYLEHCGMLDTPDYGSSFVWKMNYYENHRIRIGERLILTFESSAYPLDTRRIDDVINHYFQKGPNARTPGAFILPGSRSAAQGCT